MSSRKQYNALQKKRCLNMLDALSKKIKKGELLVVSHGFWTSGLDNKVTFKVETLSEDSKKESEVFEKIL